MDAKDLRTLPALSEHKDGSKYSQSGVTLQCNRNKSYQDMGSNPLGKAESAAVRPCAVIGPDRVVPPPPVSNDAFPKKGPIETWPCQDNIYSQLTDYPQRIVNSQNQMRNISPRQTYQENMQRIMVPPSYNSIKNSDSSTFNHGERTSVLSKNTKPNSMAPEAKYCDVPYPVNQLSNEHKNVRDQELCVPSVNSTLIRAVPHGWPPNSATLHGSRSYGAHELYQYQQYQSCAGPRPPVLPMGRTHRPYQDEAGYVYPESYYQDPSVRFKPYPQVKDRYPQPRLDYIGNYPNHFHPPPSFPPHKYDIPKPGTGPIHHYPMYQHLKYLENRVSDPTMETYQRHPNQPPPSYNMSFRNQLNHPSYPPGLTNTQSKLISYQVDSSGKPLVTNKMAYDNNNKVFIDYENARNKPYTLNDTFMVNEINRAQPVKSQIMPPNYPTNGMHPVHNPQFFRKDIAMKSHEYLPHFRNFDASVGGYTMVRHSSQFSPNAFAISPTDSNTSNDTTQTQATNQEDCGYVSQSSTASARSMESGINRMAGDYYRKSEYRYGPIGNSIHTKHETNKNKKQIDVRQFLQMWNEGDDDNGENNNSKEIVNKTTNSEMNHYSKQQQDSKQEQLYVLGLVNVPSEELSKYEHIQKVSKLPENIKGYNSIELLKQFEEAIESSNVSPHNHHHKPVPSKEFHMPIRENRNASKQVMGMLPRPLSPLDVEAKISQSVIHKEVGCNFEIKPCSPKMLNVEIPAPVQNILGERVIEKVSNPLSKIGSPMSIQSDDNASCRNIKRQDPVINYENSSCKVLSSPYSAHNLDNVKTDYSIQDLETNSGVCLASLPRLDNEIELNFPEVNQQFIDANKIDVSASNENSSPKITQTQINSPEINGSKSNITDFQDEKQSDSNLQDSPDYTKLSKYRRIKNSLLEIPEINVSAVRTDSVIIENPENHKRAEHKKHDYTQTTLKENDLSPINLTSHINIKLDDDNCKEISCIQNDAENVVSDLAIDFSLNKSDILSDKKSFETVDSSEKMDLIYDDKDVTDKKEPGLTTIDSLLPPQSTPEGEHRETVILNELNAKNDDENNEDMSFSLNSSPNEISSVTSPKDISVDNIGESNEEHKNSLLNISHSTLDDTEDKMEVQTVNINNLDTTHSSKNISDDDPESDTPQFTQPKNYNKTSTVDEPSPENNFATEEAKEPNNDKTDEKIKTHHEYSRTDNYLIPSKDNEMPEISNLNQALLKDDNDIDIRYTLLTEECLLSSPKTSGDYDCFVNIPVDERNQTFESTSVKEHNFFFTNNYNNFRKNLYSPQIQNLLLQVEGFINTSETYSNNNENIPETTEEITGNENITKNEGVIEDKEITEIADIEEIKEEEDISKNLKSIISDVESNEELQNYIKSPIAPKQCLTNEEIDHTEDTSSTTLLDCESTEATISVITEKTISNKVSLLYHEEDQCSIVEPDELTKSQISGSDSSCMDEDNGMIEELNCSIESRICEIGSPCIHEDQCIVEQPDSSTQINETEITDENDVSDNKITDTVIETVEDFDDENNCNVDKIGEIIPETAQYDNTNDLFVETETTHCQDDLSRNETENDIKPDSIKELSVSEIQECQTVNRGIELSKDTNQYFDIDTKKKTSLKRSLSDSALNSYTQERMWSSKRRRTNESNLEENIMNDNLCSFIQNARRNSISSINNEENVSFCILIDDSCILTADSEQEKICFTEITENNDVNEIEENIVMENVIQNENVFIDSSAYECQENELMNDETWVEDIACVETVVCDDIAEVVFVSSPSSPKNDYIETEANEEVAQDLIVSSPSYSQTDLIETEVNEDIAEDVIISSPSYSKNNYEETDIADDVAENIVFSSSPKPNFIETEVNEDIAEDVVISSICSESEKCEDIDENVYYNPASPQGDYIHSEVRENLAAAMGLTSPSPENNQDATESEISKDNVESMETHSLFTKDDSMGTEIFDDNIMSYTENPPISYSPSSKEIAPVVTKDVAESAIISSPEYSKNDSFEIAISNVIKGNIDISYPSTPQDICFKSDMDYDIVRSLDTGSSSMGKQTFDKMKVNNDAEEMVSSLSSSECDPSEYDEYSSLCDNLYKQTNKIKSMYRDRVTENHAQIVDTLFRTSQTDLNKTLRVRDDLLIETLSDNRYLGYMCESGNKGSQSLEYCKPRMDPNNTVGLKSTTSDENISSIPLPSPKVRSDNKIDGSRDYDVPQDNTVNSCESSTDNIFAYEDSSYTSSSPEVSSTTSEERNSSILLKITNLNGARISQINEIKSERKPRCKFTENKEYSNSSIPNRPLITKAAQKYIPPIKESIRDLKVKISLPQQSLLKLKQLKLSKSVPKVINKRGNANVPNICKKPKPNFEDVLKSIDEIQIKMHKEKNRKPKTTVPKVVIKKNEYGSHYTSTPNKEKFNPDLTGRKWQPWVFLEKNSFIDKMALKNKTTAVYNHRKKTYVLAERFKKYKSVATSTKFVISQPNSNKYTGQLKYTIRLKHSY